MKIENGYSRQLQSLKKAAESIKSNQKSSLEEAGKSKEPSVSVNISEEAQALLEADQAKYSERVEQIKAQIKNGEYSINPEAISDGLINEIQAQKEQ